MGNRFSELTEYHVLIRGHGIVAAITFLLIVPSAIFFARFYARNPVWALRLHIWLQILTVLLTTVIFVLGYFAVGPERSLTNPHHGIGLAIYVLVLFQFIFGWWIHHKEKGRGRLFIPLKLMVSDVLLWQGQRLTMMGQTHQWLGRTIALLGIAQIPLGLTLYGSPVALFVLYALAVFALLVAYFVLTYLHERRLATGYDSQYSYGSGSVVEERRSQGGLANLAKAGAVGAGLAALGERFRNRSRNRREQEVVGSRQHSGSHVEEEKYSQYGQDSRREGGWTDRLFKVGAVAGAAALAKNFFDRRKNKDRDSDTASTVYGPPLGGATPANYGPRPGGPNAPTEISEDSLARVEEGRVPVRPSGQHPLNQPLNQHRRSTSSYSYDSYTSAEDAGRQGHGVRDAVAGLGAFGLVRNIFKNRRERKEQKRVEDLRQKDLEEERIARENSQRRRYTGDGYPRRTRPQGSVTEESDLTASTENRPRYDAGVPPPLPAGIPLPPGYIPPPGVVPPAAAGAAAGVAFADQDRNRDRQGTSLGANNPVLTGGATGPAFVPPIPPAHQESSGSEAYLSAGGRTHRRHHPGRDAAAGLAAGEALAARRERRQSASGGEDIMASPPISVKVKMHGDGRHVTLRRLPEEEAAAERAARRRSRERNGRRQGGGSVSTLSNTDVAGGGERWRRNDAIEQQQAAAENIRRKNERAAETSAQGFPPPPPPLPVAGSSSVGGSGLAPGGAGRAGAGSVGSPGEGSDYANNAKRRRAERAQARLAREGRTGGSVDFS